MIATPATVTVEAIHVFTWGECAISVTCTAPADTIAEYKEGVDVIMANLLLACCSSVVSIHDVSGAAFYSDTAKKEATMQGVDVSITMTVDAVLHTVPIGSSATGFVNEVLLRAQPAAASTVRPTTEAQITRQLVQSGIPPTENVVRAILKARTLEDLPQCDSDAPQTGLYL